MARSVKFFLSVCVVILLTGCSTVEIPKYIKDANPYSRTYYAGFQETLNAVTEVVEAYGWKITETAEPSMFERSKVIEDPDTQQILLFTEVRQTGLFLGSSFQRMNLILRSKVKTETEVELRYVTVQSVPFRSFTNYTKDSTARKILDRISENLAAE